MRPSSVKLIDPFSGERREGGAYRLVPFGGGKAYQESLFPTLYFAKDGEVYDFNGLKTLAIGGAYSPDKSYRLSHGLKWFQDEQPGTRIKHQVEKKLQEIHWEVDVVLSHTIPASYIPRLQLDPIPGIDQSKEEWLDGIERTLEYQKWYTGHFHMDQQFGKLRIMLDDIAA